MVCLATTCGHAWSRHLLAGGAQATWTVCWGMVRVGVGQQPATERTLLTRQADVKTREHVSNESN